MPKDFRLTSSKKAYMLGQQRLLAAQQQLLDSVKGKEGELLDNEFHPQSVPAFAATEIFTYLREKFPEYFYKEATLNPTNPRDRSDGLGSRHRQSIPQQREAHGISENAKRRPGRRSSSRGRSRSAT